MAKAKRPAPPVFILRATSDPERLVLQIGRKKYVYESSPYHYAQVRRLLKRNRGKALAYVRSLPRREDEE
jgi:hypothetical protein